MNCSMLGADNITGKIAAPIEYHVNGSLTLFVCKSDSHNTSIQDVHTSEPYSVLIELKNSAEQPASQC